MQHNNAPAVETVGLAKTFPGGVHAVRGLDLAIGSGEVFGLLGPNGAGKSTTVGMLTTTIRPSRGSIRLAGIDALAKPIAARRASAVVFQEPVVDRGLSGRRNCMIHARLWGVDPRVAAARIGELARSFGLTKEIDRPVSSYSGGQRRRLEIARALVTQPRLLFLDEPTVGLDPLIRYELLDLIAGLRASADMTILLTTHYLDEAERLCDRVAIMHAGEVVALDTPQALLGRLGREIIEVRIDGDGARGLTTLRAGRVAGTDAFAIGSTVTVPLHDRPATDAINALRDAAVSVVAVTTRPPNLDDVYLGLTGSRLAA
jgi:ABC-2 type transport system ATP-binding protein